MFLGTCTMNILGKSMVSTMDGRNPVPVGRWAVYPMISHDLQCFMVTHSYPAWCRIACPQFNNFQQKPPCFLVKSPFSYGFSNFSYGFSYDFPSCPMVFLWFSYGFPMVFPGSSQEAAKKAVGIIGPATVGGMMPGRFRIGNAGGAVETPIRTSADQGLRWMGPLSWMIFRKNMGNLW